MSELVKRHKIKLDGVGMRFEHDYARIPRFIALGGRNANALTDVYHYARNVLVSGLCVEPNSELLPKCLRLAGRALAAFFKAAVSDQEVTFSISDTEVARVRGPCDESTVHGGRWEDGFFVNVLARQAEQLQWLCDVPMSLLRKSSTKGPRFSYDLPDVLQSFWLSSDKLPEKIEIARSHLKEADYDYFPLRGRYYLELVDCIRIGSDDFNDVLLEAVKAHKTFWTKSTDRKWDFDGLIAKELCALAALAHDRGMKIEVQSDYLPMPLITGEILRVPAHQ